MLQRDFFEILSNLNNLFFLAPHYFLDFEFFDDSVIRFRIITDCSDFPCLASFDCEYKKNIFRCIHIFYNHPNMCRVRPDELERFVPFILKKYCGFNRFIFALYRASSLICSEYFSEYVPFDSSFVYSRAQSFIIK